MDKICRRNPHPLPDVRVRPNEAKLQRQSAMLNVTHNPLHLKTNTQLMAGLRHSHPHSQIIDTYYKR